MACLGQQVATTAQQMVVFVSIKDLHRKRAKEMLTMETQNVQKNSPTEKQAKRIKT